LDNPFENHRGPKLVPDTALLTPSTVTVIGPVVEPAGAVTTIWVEVPLVITALIPLKKVTALFPGVGSKFVPVMVMIEPTGALAGVIPEIEGGGTTVKLTADVAPWSTSVVVTVIGPDVAP
jgi:hypothetical protein